MGLTNETAAERRQKRLSRPVAAFPAEFFTILRRGQRRFTSTMFLRVLKSDEAGYREEERAAAQVKKDFKLWLHLMRKVDKERRTPVLHLPWEVRYTEPDVFAWQLDICLPQSWWREQDAQSLAHVFGTALPHELELAALARTATSTKFRRRLGEILDEFG